MCLLSKYLGLHKINGRKGEGAHCRVAVGEGLRASFGKNLDVLAIRFQVLFADGNLKVVAMIGRRYGRIPYGFYGVQGGERENRQLRYGRAAENKKRPVEKQVAALFCDADRTQTCNLLIRSQMLYSVKLRSRFQICFFI